MTRRLGPSAVLVVMLAVLLPAAVLAATTLDGRTPTDDRRVGAAGLTLEGVSEEAAASQSAAVTVAPPTSAPAAPTSPAPSAAPRGPTTRSTTTTPAINGPTTSSVPAGPPSSLPRTTVPRIPPVSSWTATNMGITVRMRMEPAEPAAGEPVDFVVEVTPYNGCCIVYLTFGDGSAAPLPVGVSCNRTSAVVRATTTHTYAAAGAYKVMLNVVNFPCGGMSFPPTDGQPPAPTAVYGANIEACAVIGPESTARTACTA